MGPARDSTQIMSEPPIRNRTSETFHRQANLWPLVFSALPLGCWPFLLVPNLMSLAGEQQSVEQVVTAVSKCFLWGSAVYPLVYIAALIIVLVLAFIVDRPTAATVVSLGSAGLRRCCTRLPCGVGHCGITQTTMNPSASSVR